MGKDVTVTTSWHFTPIATAKGTRRIENDTEEAIPTTVHDVRTLRTLATGRHRLRHRYRQTGRFATTLLMSAHACLPRREGHVKAPQECGEQPLTQSVLHGRRIHNNKTEKRNMWYTYCFFPSVFQSNEACTDLHIDSR